MIRDPRFQINLIFILEYKNDRFFEMQDVMDFHLSDLEEEDIEMLEFNRDHRWPVRSSRQSPAYEFMNGGPAH